MYFDGKTIVTVGTPHVTITFHEVSFKVLYSGDFDAVDSDHIATTSRGVFDHDGRSMLAMLHATTFDADGDGLAIVMTGRYEVGDGTFLDITVRCHDSYVQFHEHYVYTTGSGVLYVTVIQRLM